MEKYLKIAGGILLVLIIFGVPAVLVPVTMTDVPERSRIKVLTAWQDAVDTARMNFERHRDPERSGGRLQPLPVDTHAWIERMNPLGRKAPGGGLAILPNASVETGAIGVRGDQRSVTITLPAYNGLKSASVTVPDVPVPDAAEVTHE